MTDKIETTDVMEEKQKALKTALQGIEKQFGKGSIMRLGDAGDKINVQVIPTGFIQIDSALGAGGIPKGRITEIYGPESSGKTTLTLHIIAQAQKNGGIAAFIDAEHALDPNYAQALGVDIDNLYVSQPDTGEQALDICEALARSNAVDLIVIDSVAALTPKAEIEGDMESATVGMQARLMSRALRKITAVVGKSNTAVIFINQLRDKIGVLYGNPETTTGGKALKFFASVRIDIRKGEPIKNGSELIGNKCKIKVVKNKVAPPFKTAEVDMLFGKGISRESSLMDFAIESGIITKSGSWFSYNGERIGQGKENAKEFMLAHPEIMEEVEQLLRDSIKNNTAPVAKDDLDEDD
jgi:recombination protein RecA